MSSSDAENVKKVMAVSLTMQKIAKRKSTVPDRLAEIANKAVEPEKPAKPGLGACCGSSCDPCVLTLYAEEVKVWKEYREAAGTTADPQAATVVETAVEETAKEIYLKIPGAWVNDW